MGSIIEFGAAKNSSNIVSVENEQGRDQIISWYVANQCETDQVGNIPSPIEFDNSIRIGVSPCGRRAIVHPGPDEEGQAVILALGNEIYVSKIITCGAGFGFGFDRLFGEQTESPPQAYFINGFGMVINVAECGVDMDACPIENFFKFATEPDICRHHIWGSSTGFFAFSDDQRFSIIMVDRRQNALVPSQTIPFSHGQAICADYVLDENGVAYFYFSEMGGALKCYCNNGTDVFREAWRKEWAAGHAVDLVASRRGGSLAGEGVTVTALIYHYNNSGFSVEEYNESGDIVRSRDFLDGGNPPGARLFNSGKNLLKSRLRNIAV